jgi:hypothetical protein
MTLLPPARISSFRPLVWQRLFTWSKKNRLSASAYDDLKAALASPEYVIAEAPFNSEIVEAMRTVSRAEVPDMPDRIIAATGIYFRVPVISRDGRIRSSTVKTIW